MLLSDFRILPDDRHAGTVFYEEEMTSEFFGPFGVGYNLRVRAPRGTATLQFLRDYAGARVIAPSGKYEMSDETVHDRERKRLTLVGDELQTDLTDPLLLTVFVINHHFWRKTGPFK